jgi:hypothetical protein
MHPSSKVKVSEGFDDDTWQTDFTCRFVADQNLATHATKYSDDSNTYLALPAFVSAESARIWSHLMDR